EVDLHGVAAAVPDVARHPLGVAAARVLAVGDDEQVLAEDAGAIEIGARLAHRVADRRAAAGLGQLRQRVADRRPIVRLDRAQRAHRAREAVEADLDGKVGTLGDEGVGGVEHRLERLARDQVLRARVARSVILHRAGGVDENRHRGAEPFLDFRLVGSARLGLARVGCAAGAVAAAVRVTGRDQPRDQQDGSQPGPYRPPGAQAMSHPCQGGSVSSAPPAIKRPSGEWRACTGEWCQRRMPNAECRMQSWRYHGRRSVPMLEMLIAGLVLQQPSPSNAQPQTATSAAAAAIAAAAAPADCVRALQAFVGKRQQEVRPPEGFTAQLLRQVETERAALAKTCIGRFPEDQLPAMQLGGLSELYTQAGDPERARAVLTRAMAAPLPPADRSRLLATAINVTLTEPKGDERNARLEKMIDELDAIKEAPFDQVFLAHRRLLGYYRGDDIDAGIIKHATWIASAAKA